MKKTLILATICASLWACNKDLPFEMSGKVGFTNLTENSVDIISTVFVTNAESSFDRGIVYGFSANPTVWDNYKAEGTGNGNYTVQITGLQEGQTYYVRPYVTYRATHYYGDEISFTVPVGPLQIGDIGPAGGTVFHLDSAGGGLECVQMPWSWDWGCEGTDIPGLSSAFGEGYNNTQTIAAFCASTEAAANGCLAYSFGGFDDWYLPSLDELDSIYTKVFVPGHFTADLGVYYSSTQDSPTNAFVVSFYDGNVISTQKGVPGPYVAAVRNF